MSKINEHILKVSSSGVCLPKNLDLGKRYLISTEVDVTDINHKDNQDGTINLIYKGKQTGNLEILDEGKKIIKAEAKGSVSRSMHGAIWHYYNQEGVAEDFDVYYEKIGRKLISYMPEIIRFLETKS